MKKVLLIIILISSPVLSFCQVIRGIVLDRETREPVISAAVYFNGTSAGTLSDENGRFVMDVSKYNRRPITVSAIGYYSSDLKDYTAQKQIQVLLRPKTFELNEVQVNAKSFYNKRKQNLGIFRNEFLGRNVNAAHCTIANEDDIRFTYSDNEDTVKAYAKGPVIIENKSLGYTLTYYLDHFEYDRINRMFLFRGDLFFNEDTVTDADKMYEYEHERKKAYLGSRMHFFRSLWMNNLEADGFKVRNAAGRILAYGDMVFEADDRTKYLNYPTKLSITYMSDPVPSYIVFVGKNVYFDPSGYYDATKISWEGKMSAQRIADQLPYDYQPSNNR